MPGYSKEYGERAYLEDLSFAVTIVRNQIPRLSTAEENWLHKELSVDDFKKYWDAIESNIYVRKRTIITLGALNLYISEVLERLKRGTAATEAENLSDIVLLAKAQRSLLGKFPDRLETLVKSNGIIINDNGTDRVDCHFEVDALSQMIEARAKAIDSMR
ncbi:hypothetical protein N9L29_03540 [Litoricolaceae bacterium]|nr:hypothetical protein [Litorivicinaceae bacterium]